jgi:hypothetical protein
MIWAHPAQAPYRALRGFRHANNKPHAVHGLYYWRDRSAPLQSLAHEPGGGCANESLWLRALICGIFVKPCSGVRRATGCGVCRCGLLRKMQGVVGAWGEMRQGKNALRSLIRRWMSGSARDVNRRQKPPIYRPMASKPAQPGAGRTLPGNKGVSSPYNAPR